MASEYLLNNQFKVFI